MANVRLTTPIGVNDHYCIIDDDFTASSGDKVIAKVGGKTVTLPSATKHGMEVWIKNIGSTAVTVASAGTDLIMFSLSSYSIPASTTYKFVVSTEGYWMAELYQGTDNLVTKKMGDAFVFVSLTAGVAPIVQSTSELK